MEQQSQELLKREFMHFISDTVALLGGGDGIVTQIRQSEEKPITAELIDFIRQYNIDEIEGLKKRFDICNRLDVSVSQSQK